MSAIRSICGALAVYSIVIVPALAQENVLQHDKLLKGHESYFLQFSPDGNKIVTASADYAARLWDGRSGKEIAVLKGHKDSLFSAQFSPDGSKIVTASGDKTARLWDTKTGQGIATLKGHEGSVLSAQLSLDGSKIVTASHDKTARLWDVSRQVTSQSLKSSENNTASAPANSNCSDPSVFHEALLEHDKVRIEFQWKMQTGYRRRAKRGDIAHAGMRNEILYSGPDATIAAIRSHLQALDLSGRAGLLIYQPGNGSCVWFVDSFGRVIAGEVRTPDRLAHMFRDRAGITARSVNRMPKKRNAARSLERESTEPERGSVDDFAEHILPPEIQEAIEDSVSTLLILPSRDLSAVPFAALKIGRDERSLIDFALPVMLPTVDALFFWVKAPKRFSKGSAIVVGDPDLSEDTEWRFIPLPGANEEARFVAKTFGAKPLIGKQATFDAVTRKLRDKNIVYLATHGVSDSKNPMDGSFLALKGRHLTGSEIKKYRYTSPHPIVVMSACQSGLGKTFESGIFGLARAWIYAGASQVVASLWNVDDVATAFLMKRFAANLKNEGNTEFALRRAILDAREKDPDPALWAGFTLFGYPQPKDN